MRPPRHRVVRIDRDLHQAGPAARHAGAVRAGDGEQRRRHRAVDALRVCRDHGGRAVLQWRAKPVGGYSRARAACERQRHSHLGQGLQDGPDLDEDDHRAGPEGAHARTRRLVFDEHPWQSRR